MTKAVILTHYGAPDVLVWSDVPMPQPGPGQVRIRVKAAGVSPTDPKIRRGDLEAVFPLPANAVLGFEAASSGSVASASSRWTTPPKPIDCWKSASPTKSSYSKRHERTDASDPTAPRMAREAHSGDGGWVDLRRAQRSHPGRRRAWPPDVRA
jgi:hypothetical protein